jgi:hypothetical protein
LSDGAKGDGKKKIFSLFKSSPSTSRRPTISAPSNATHITHVGIDNETGKFTVSSSRFSSLPQTALTPRACPYPIKHSCGFSHLIFVSGSSSGMAANVGKGRHIPRRAN